MSTSATSFKATRTIGQFRRQQGDDYMQTFGALQEEKRRRLLDTATAGAAAGPQLSKQQMNDFDRRLYTVVQRMSAFNRYRRKRKKTTTTQIEHHSSQPNDRIAQLQAEINDDWKRLISNLQINAKIYRQWANELPGQQPTVETQEQPQQQASAFDVQRNAFRNAIMGLLKSPEQQMRDEERSKLFKEHMRMEEARLEEQQVRLCARGPNSPCPTWARTKRGGRTKPIRSCVNRPTNNWGQARSGMARGEALSLSPNR